MSADRQADITKLAREQSELARARMAALDEIEAMATFNLPADYMRKEIARIISDCRAKIAARVEASKGV